VTPRAAALLLVSLCLRLLARSLACCAARDIIPSPHGHTTKKFGCLRRAPKTNPTKRRRFNKHGNVVVRWPMLSLSYVPVFVMQEDQVGNKKLGGGRGDTSRPEREHIWGL
jgi:hypothetical protein